MVLLGGSIVVVGLPTSQADLHTQLSDLQWTVDGYTLPFAALMLSTGALSDRFGRKRVFLIGLVVFLIGSTFCGFASNLGWLIFDRVVQGVGAAALSPGSLSLLVSTFSEPHARAQAIGILSCSNSLATLSPNWSNGMFPSRSVQPSPASLPALAHGPAASLCRADCRSRRQHCIKR
jgi:MFS family permease